MDWPGNAGPGPAAARSHARTRTKRASRHWQRRVNLIDRIREIAILPKRRVITANVIQRNRLTVEVPPSEGGVGQLDWPGMNCWKASPQGRLGMVGAQSQNETYAPLSAPMLKPAKFG